MHYTRTYSHQVLPKMRVSIYHVCMIVPADTLCLRASLISWYWAFKSFFFSWIYIFVKLVWPYLSWKISHPIPCFNWPTILSPMVRSVVLLKYLNQTLFQRWVPLSSWLFNYTNTNLHCSNLMLNMIRGVTIIQFENK